MDDAKSELIILAKLQIQCVMRFRLRKNVHITIFF